MPKLYDVAAVMPGGGLYFFGQPSIWPVAFARMMRARARDFSRAVRVLLRSGFECYPIVFRLVEVADPSFAGSPDGHSVSA